MDQRHNFHSPTAPSFEHVTLAVLEDDPVSIEAIKMGLQSSDCAINHYTTVAEIVQAIETRHHDLYLLDWRLPDGEASEVIKKIREHSGWAVPILIQSGLGEEQQIASALRLGADDYVQKPLRITELHARIFSLLRRVHRDYRRTLILGRYQLDLSCETVTLNASEIPLTLMEFKLLIYLAEHRDELIGRERLLRDVWHVATEVDTRTIDTHICALRRKLNLGQENGLLINCVRSQGYRIEECSV